MGCASRSFTRPDPAGVNAKRGFRMTEKRCQFRNWCEGGKQLFGFVVGHGDLLIARVEITTYNDPAAAGSAPFSEPPFQGSGGPTGVPKPDLGRPTRTKSTWEQEPTQSSNQPPGVYLLFIERAILRES